MDKIKNALTEGKISQQGGAMRIGGHEKEREDSVAGSAKLILIPCLCDLTGATIGRLEAVAPDKFSVAARRTSSWKGAGLNRMAMAIVTAALSLVGLSLPPHAQQRPTEEQEPPCPEPHIDQVKIDLSAPLASR